MKVSSKKVQIEMARKLMTINDLSNQSGITRIAIRKILSGVQNPKPKTIGRLAAALGVDVTEIIEAEG